VPVKPVSKYEKIDYSSSYEPAPDIGFDNEFSKLGLISDMVKGLANQGMQNNPFHLIFSCCIIVSI
jgi:hypothetical protein